MFSDGKKGVTLVSGLLILCGIVTMIMAFMARSGNNKTKDTMDQLQSYYEQQNNANSGNAYGYGATASSRSESFRLFDEWHSKSNTYSMIMIIVSGLHIVAGALGFVFAGKSGSSTMLFIIGGVLVMGAAGVIIYPLISNKSDYDAIEATFKMIKELLNTFGGSSSVEFDLNFDMLALKPFTQIITYTSAVLGLGFLGAAAMSGQGGSSFSSSSASRTKSNPLNLSGIDQPDDFFAQFNKPPTAPKAPMGAPMGGQPRPQGAPMQGQPPMGGPRPQGAPPQGRPPMPGQPRPQGAPPQGQPPMGGPRPQGAPPQGQPPMGGPRPQGAPPQGQPPMGGPRPQGAPPQGQPPIGGPRPQGASPQGRPPMPGQPRPQGAPMQPMQGQPRPAPNVRPAPNIVPAPGVRPPAADDEGPMSSGAMDEVILPSAEDLERILGGMSGQK